MTTLRLPACIFVAIATLFLAACATQPRLAETTQCKGRECSTTPYVIGPGDLLHISVWRNATLDRVVTVRPDGYISFPLLNDVRAVGMTPEQLQETIKVQLGRFVSNPEVAVVVQQVHSFVVSVLGEVKKPGRYEFNASVTVLDVLAQAGGLTDFAKESSIVVIRKNGNSRERIPFNYDAATSGKEAGGLLEVRPGDIVVVP